MPMIMKDSKRKKKRMVPSRELSRKRPFSCVDDGSSFHQAISPFTPLHSPNDSYHRSGAVSHVQHLPIPRTPFRYTAEAAGRWAAKQG